MKYKDKNLMTPFAKALVFLLVLAMMSLTVSTASAAITVDGNVGDWPNGFVKADPTNDPAIHGYDLVALYMDYDDVGDILYFRLDVAPGKLPADLDGNGNTDTDCAIGPGPGDCPGVGPYEQYTIGLSGGGPGAVLSYTNNSVALGDGNAAHNAIVEFSLSNAASYVDPTDFCMVVTAGGSFDGPGEDNMSECFVGEQDVPSGEEFWVTEWFQTYPDQYTQFVLPDDQKYLTTLSWEAPESVIHLWDGLTVPIATYEGERVKFIHDPKNRSDDIYFGKEVAEEGGTIKVYGTFGEGPGDHDFVDPETDLKPENPPYTDPIAPFYPQANQSPVKDHITFNPAILDHNDQDFDWYSLLDFGINYEAEKVFTRLSYEKEWFKDHNTNGCYDVVLYNETLDTSKVVCLEDENQIHDLLSSNWTMQIHNNYGTVDGQIADIYGPAIIQEFTYMFLNDTMPTPVENGSSVLIPMASEDQIGDGIDSFMPIYQYPYHEGPQAVEVESEETLGLDIDGDGVMEPMDADGIPLSGDETVVLVLRNQRIAQFNELQMFDHRVQLTDVSTSGKATFIVRDNEGDYYNKSSVADMNEGDVKYFYRAKEGGSSTEKPAFYLKLITADFDDNRATIEVGRMFGQAGANIAANANHSQKAFWVDEVFYNIVAIKAYENNEIKYITFRQKLPKEGFPIKIHDNMMNTWVNDTELPVMPPFNMDHKVHEDVQTNWTHDKIGPIQDADPLYIEWAVEEDEMRFKGELKEIYNESNGDEFWMIEWFKTLPWQYTSFHIDERFDNESWLLTSGFFAPESYIHIWDGAGETEPMFTKKGERVKFWFNYSYEPLYIDDGELRVFGTFGEGPGDQTFIDPVTQLKPENKPYTDPMGPFNPQSDQAPVKDHVTFNPAYMDHNEHGPVNSGTANGDYSWYSLLDFGVNYEAQKVFKRMSYEKEWFKDHNTNGCYDVVLYNETLDTSKVVCLEDENQIHDLVSTGWIMQIHNNEGTVDGQPADIYGPAIIQDFTYMFLNNKLPTKIPSGSSVLIPMASEDQIGDGIDSFTPIYQPPYHEGPQAVQVESEESLGLDIDGDGVMEPMDADGNPLSGDETVVLVLRNQRIMGFNELQMFDHRVQLTDISTSGKATFIVRDNEGDYYNKSSVVDMNEGDVKYFYRAKEGGSPTEKPAFYLKLNTADYLDNRATIEVGRMFGQAGANIAANANHSQKAFWVDEVFYNIVAIKAYDKDMIKYITIRQKLPKEGYPIKIHDNQMREWAPGDNLSELPPFNMNHVIHDDVQYNWTKPMNLDDKIGPPKYVGPLVINYTSESTEPRYHGEIKEIYWEVGAGIVNPESPCTAMDLNIDGFVNFDDVLIMVSHWTENWAPGDFNGDNIVNFDDVLEMIPLWGTCT